MKDLLTDIISNNKKGLALIDTATGTGKTFNVSDYIAQEIDELVAQKRKIIFITHLKKNLPFAELKQRFIAHNKVEYDKQAVLYVQSSLDAFQDHYVACMDDIKAMFSSFKPYTLKQLLDYHQKLNNAPAQLVDASKKTIEKEIGKLKVLVKRKLRKDFKQLDKRIEALKTDENWQWVSKLFPATLTLDKSVLFMTVDKFIYPYDTLVQSPTAITELLAEYNVTLFIDEFDASKQRLQTYIIEQGLQKPIDLVATIQQLAVKLTAMKIPNHLLLEQKLEKQPATPQAIEQGLREKSQQVANEFHLDLSLKSREQPTNSAFIFYDKQVHYLANARHQVLTLTPDTDNHALWIDIVQKDKNHAKDSLTLGNLISTTSHAIRYFKGGINMLANNYHAHKRYDGTTYDNAVRSFVDWFSLETNSFDNLVYEIQYGRLTQRWQPKDTIALDDDDPLRFHEQGFSYHTVTDSEDHAGRSKVDTYNFPHTAEAMLLSWCRHFMVVGVSATANISTRLGNYDLHYLRERLNAEKDCSFIHLTAQQQQRLTQQLIDSTNQYRKVSIDVQAHGLPTSDDDITIKDAYIKLFGGKQAEDDVNDLFNHLPIDNLDDDNRRQHQLRQFYKIFVLWVAYQQQKITAFLVLFSKGYRKELDFIQKYCSVLSNNLNLPDNAQQEIVCVVGNTSENQIDTIKIALSQGERRFVLSTYATLGAGVNIQYPIPKGLKSSLAKINNRNANDYMDFDGLYLDKPTQLIKHLSKDIPIRKQDLVQRVFQLEYLKLAGLTPTDFEKYLQNAFALYANTPYPQRTDESLYDFDDYKHYLMQVLIQAIGRICRTNMKRPHIHLHIDNALTEQWQADLDSEQMLPEFHKINEFIEQQRKQKRQNSALEKVFQQQDFERFRLFINKMLIKIAGGTMIQDDIVEWETLRQIVLTYPQKRLATDTRYDFLYQDLGEPQRRYFYHQYEDYQSVIVLKNKERGAFEVSEQSARLDKLMQHQGLRQHFIENGYATELIETTHWLRPILFNNIYKGALGEVAGAYLWHSYDLPTLHKMPEQHFERFDYQIDDTIYVDFKYWQGAWQDGESAREEIFTKMDIVRAKLVFVINILSDNDNLKPITVHNHPGKGDEQVIVEVPYFIQTNHLGNLEQLATIRQLIADYQTL